MGEEKRKKRKKESDLCYAQHGPWGFDEGQDGVEGEGERPQQRLWKTPIALEAGGRQGPRRGPNMRFDGALVDPGQS